MRAASATSRRVGSSAEPSGEDRRPERFEVGLAGESVVEPFETSRRVEEQRSVVASASAGEHDLGPQPRHPGPLEVVQRAELGGREQFLGGVRVGGIELGVRRRQSAAPSVGPGRPSARPLVAGTRLPRRRRHGSSPVRLTVPGRRRRPRPASWPRAHGARRDDRDLREGRWRRRARDGRPDGRPGCPTGRPPSERADDGSGLWRRTRSTRRPRPAPRPQVRSRDVRRRAATGPRRPSARPPPRAAAVGSAPGATAARLRKLCSMLARQRPNVREREAAGQLCRGEPAG